MSKPLLIGITGGIGSGKSTVCKIFRSLNVPVYYADDRGKKLLTENDSLVSQVKSEFGHESYLESGELNRQYLAEKVFSNPEALEKLSQLVHPVVASDFKEWVSLNQSSPYLLKEAALLFETVSYKQLDRTICVLASEKVRLQRVLLRDPQRAKSQVENIMSQQTNDQERKGLSDYLIINESDEMLIPQVMKVHEKILELTGN